MFPFQEFLRFANNPIQYLNKNGIQIPKESANSPDAIIQYMMNNGLLSQQQYNQAVNLSNQLKQNPNFIQLFNKYISH